MYNTLMQPGETITPGSQQPSEQNQQDEPALQPPIQEIPVSSGQPEPEQTEAPQPENGWDFHPEEDGVPQSPAPLVAMVHWTASEYVAHDKNAGWYLLVVLGSALVAAVIFLITRDMISPAVVFVLGMSFAVFGARKPRVLDYAIDNTGVQIGSRHYPYGLFKTFSIVQEGAVRSILLMPLQRFNLPISVYYDPADEDKIIEALSVHLPHEDRKVGPIDNFTRKIRF